MKRPRHIPRLLALFVITCLQSPAGQQASHNHRFVSDPVKKLTANVPELSQLKPSEDQSHLAEILARVGERVAVFARDATNVTSRERATQQILNTRGGILKERDSIFSYIILSRHEMGDDIFEEYRTDAHGNRASQVGLDEGYMITSNFAAACLHLDAHNQRDATFRYLGEEMMSGQETFVVAFEQNPGARMSAKVNKDGMLRDVFIQGIVWIEKRKSQIVRMHTSYLEPIPELGLSEQSTDIQFSEVRPGGMESTLWLPLQVTVNSTLGGRQVRNLHRYSDWRVFRVSIQIKPGLPQN